MDVSDPRLSRQSRFSRASEHATREAMERAGSTVAEIDHYQLRGHLQWTIFKNLLKFAILVWLALDLLGWIDFTINWMTAGITAVVMIALYAIAFLIAKDHATRWEWVDVGGGYVRKDALEASAHYTK